MTNKKLFSQACENNKQAILEVLKAVFTEPGVVLEIGSGSGQHAAYMAAGLPHIRWQPSDMGETLESINTYRDDSGLDNLLPPVMLNVMDTDWPITSVQGIFSANTAHIMSWGAVQEMFSKVAELLSAGQSFCLYGPFNYGGKFTSEGNKRLDVWAKSINPKSGIRDIEAIEELAQQSAMQLITDYQMPANNHIIHFMKNKS